MTVMNALVQAGVFQNLPFANRRHARTTSIAAGELQAIQQTSEQIRAGVLNNS